MGADASRVQQKRVSYLVTLRNEFAISRAGVPVEETLVDCVVNNLNVIERDLEQLFNLIACEIRDCEDSGRAGQHPFRRLKVQGSPDSLLPCPRHMLQHVMHGHHIRARQKAWD